jgi:uncharacterized protein (DUF849 family)
MGGKLPSAMPPLLPLTPEQIAEIEIVNEE